MNRHQRGSALLVTIVVLGFLSILAVLVADQVRYTLGRLRSDLAVADHARESAKALNTSVAQYDQTFPSSAHNPVELLPNTLGTETLEIATSRSKTPGSFRPAWESAGAAIDPSVCTTWVTNTPVGVETPHLAEQTCTAIRQPLTTTVTIPGNLSLAGDLALQPKAETPLRLIVMGALNVAGAITVADTASGRIELVAAGSVTMQSIQWPNATHGELLVHSAAGILTLIAPPLENADPLCTAGFHEALALRLEAPLIRLSTSSPTKDAAGCALDRAPQWWRLYRFIGQWTPVMKSSG